MTRGTVLVTGVGRRRGIGATLAADLADADVPALLVGRADARGDLRGLVLSHCESTDSAVLTTTVESWDRHFAVNARAAWLMIRALAERLPEPAEPGAATGRVVALTSDHTAHNLPQAV